MSRKASQNVRAGYCIYINTLCQGPVPILTDGEGKYIVFETEVEAQREIVDHAMIRLQQFLDGERDFDDAIMVEEYVVSVTLHQDGSFTDEAGNRFPSHVE
ncbi:MAG TPA: hypothetical protein VFC07_00220 [Verrucomicrobiae bacterium]|nr:hypothetical protein [Verrucomicrobiae bacterium]